MYRRGRERRRGIEESIQEVTEMSGKEGRREKGWRSRDAGEAGKEEESR